MWSQTFSVVWIWPKSSRTYQIHQHAKLLGSNRCNMDFQQQLPKWLTAQCLTNQSLSKVSRSHFYSSIPKNVVDTSLKFQFNFWNFYSSNLFLRLIFWNHMELFLKSIQVLPSNGRGKQKNKPILQTKILFNVFFELNL